MLETQIDLLVDLEVKILVEQIQALNRSITQLCAEYCGETWETAECQKCR